MCIRCNDGLKAIIGKTITEATIHTVNGDTSDALRLIFSDGSVFMVESRSHDDSWFKTRLEHPYNG